ncbi:MAG TPA: hypothetical protein VJN48_16260 [Terriglobales bacterium]|nr:hypothetical protein [Terriglobales bacterium]
MGWITEEYSRRSPAAAPSQAPDQARQHAIANLWLELRDGLQADVNEYNRWGGTAFFDGDQGQAVVSDPITGLQVRIQADLPDRHLRYEFEAARESVPAPDGGFFSIHISAADQPELFSADQPLTCEQARRVLLQPVLFPSDTSTPLRQSA